MFTGVVKGSKQKEQIEKHRSLVDIFEFRIDTFSAFELDMLSNLKDIAKKPVIFTLRSESHGGFFKGNSEDYARHLRSLLSLEPDYIDIECDIDLELFLDLKEKNLTTKFILSYHNFIKTPDLDSIYQEMKKYSPDIYKIACHANSSLDAIDMLCLASKTKDPFIGISMGPLGHITRILAPIFNTCFSYVPISKEDNIESQLSLGQLIDIYHVDHLGPTSKIYALLGDPVDKSPSHISHNAIFANRRIDAVYVKIHLKKEEIESFFSKIKPLPFAGFSVTMPHKENPFLLQMEASNRVKCIGALNTLVLEGEEYYSDNTDSLGAIDAICQRGSVAGKRIAILGTGGTARAICYEAIEQQALVTLVSRSRSKAKNFADRFQCQSASYDQLVIDYDILINATPVGMDGNHSPISKDSIAANSIVMDVIPKPYNTRLLKDAKSRGCICIHGVELFAYQAIYQYRIWFGKDFNSFDDLLVVATSFAKKSR